MGAIAIGHDNGATLRWRIDLGIGGNDAIGEARFGRDYWSLSTRWFNVVLFYMVFNYSMLFILLFVLHPTSGQRGMNNVTRFSRIIPTFDPSWFDPPKFDCFTEFQPKPNFDPTWFPGFYRGSNFSFAPNLVKKLNVGFD